MDKTTAKQQKRTRRHNRIRARVFGTAQRPRLAVYRSNTALYAQLINDEEHRTIAASDTRGMRGDTPRARARALGADIAQRAKALGVEEVVFDRGGFLYTGAVRELAEGVREAGLKF